ALTSVAMAHPVHAHHAWDVNPTVFTTSAEGGDSHEDSVPHDPASTRGARSEHGGGAHEVVRAPVEIQASAVYTQVELSMPEIPHTPHAVFIPLVTGGTDTVSIAGVQVIPKKIDMKILVV